MNRYRCPGPRPCRLSPAIAFALAVPWLLTTVASAGRGDGGGDAEDRRRAVERRLESVREEHGLPALGVAVIVDGRTVIATATGVRVRGTNVRVERDDRFHLGSCTKAMTATLFEVVERAPPRNEPLAKLLPDLAERMLPAYRSVTIDHLLVHRAGLPHTRPEAATLREIHRFSGEPRHRRRRYVELILGTEPIHEAGAKMAYSNAGYVVAAHALERATGQSWERLMREELFRPLGITSGGFGAAGDAKRRDEPWPHRWDGTRLVPVAPGPFADNPVAIGPAGTAHMSMADWARFVAAHLGTGDLLSEEQRAALHTPALGGTYAAGWMVTERGWAGEDRTVLTHAGSNTMNHCVAWLAPAKRFAVLVATNAGGPAAPRACDAVASAMVRRFAGGG